LPGGGGSRKAEPEQVWELLAPWSSQGEGELWRAAAYRFHAVVAERWQNGRMFIAGDAAHQTPPFMAQGLNQGFKDVTNLAWKIGQVHKYGAPPSILESYSEERQPNAMAAIEVTKALGKIICELDTERAAERNRAMLAEVDAGKGEFVRQDLLPPLKPGSLIAPDGRYSKGAGKTFPQPLVGHGSQPARMDNIVTGRFVLFVDRSTALTAAVVECANKAGVEIVQFAQKSITGVTALNELNGVGSAWLESHSVIAALARPDHIVFGTAEEVEECEGLMVLLLRALSLDRV